MGSYKSPNMGFESREYLLFYGRSGIACYHVNVGVSEN